MAHGEAVPGLPTSGQILGVLVRSLGITHPHLGDKTAQRFFSGRLRERVMECSRARIAAPGRATGTKTVIYLVTTVS